MAEIFNAAKQTEEIPELEELEKKGQYRSALGGLLVSPDKTSFESQENDEKVVIMGRKHFVTNVGWIAMACFAFFIPLFWGEFPFIKVLTTNVNFELTLAWYAGLLFYVIQNFLLWFYNVYIVTNERVVDIDFLGLLNNSVNVTQIEKIEDVSYSQRGMLSSFFNYGNVEVETASEQKNEDGRRGPDFDFLSVSSPALVVKIISELMEIEEREHEISRV